MDPLGRQLWAWFTEYPGGSIGLVGAYMPSMGAHVPLIGRSEEHIRSLESIAQSHRDTTGQRVWLREFIMFKDHEDLP